MKNKVTGIVLAAGKGSRMQMDIPKQFLEVEGRPILYYSLCAFAQSTVDNIILVTRQEDIEYCRKDIVARYQMDCRHVRMRIMY